MSLNNLPLRRVFQGPDGRGVAIEVGFPVVVTEGGDWSCPYRVTGMGDERIHQAFGVDAIQALVLALTYLSSTLYCSDAYGRSELSWLGDADLGLPTTRIVAEMLRERRG